MITSDVSVRRLRGLGMRESGENRTQQTIISPPWLHQWIFIFVKYRHVSFFFLSTETDTNLSAANPTS